MNQYYLPLNIKTESVLNPNWREVIPDLGDNFIKKYNVDTLQLLLEKVFFQKLNLISPVWHMLVFQSNKHHVGSCHLDVSYATDSFIKYHPYAINLVVHEGPEIGSMNWYKQKVERQFEVSYTYNGIIKVETNKDELELVDTCSIDDIVTLVRTNIPHNVAAKNSKRICFSIRLHQRKEELPWEQVVDIFRKMFNVD